MKKQLLCMLLALALLCALLPAAALAGGVVDTVELTLPAPAVGAYPAQFYEITCTGGSAYVNSANWTEAESGDMLYDGDAFLGGRQYSLTLDIRVTGGEAFSAHPTVLLCGETVADIDVTRSGSGTQLTVNHTFPRLDNAVISSVSIAVNAPKAGELPQYVAQVETEGCQILDYNDDGFISGVYWRNPYKNGEKIDAFQPGAAYEVSFMLAPLPGYEFQKDANGKLSASVTINGQSADYAGFVSWGDPNVICNYEFPALPSEEKTLIPSVSLTIPEPAAGGDIAAVQVTTADSEYTIDSTQWMHAGMSVSSGNFVAGDTYTLSVQLTAKAGFTFTKQSAVSAKATVNGREATIIKMADGMQTDVEVSMVFKIPAAPKEITAVSPGVAAPKANSTASFYPTAGGNGSYYIDSSWTDDGAINGTRWCALGSADINDVKKVLGSSDKFESGTIYMVTLALKAKDGYVFPASVTSDLSRLTIGGTAVNHAVISGGRLYVSRIFAPTDVVMVSLAVTKAPGKTVYTAGEKFDRSGMEVTATFSDGSKKLVDKYDVSPSGALTEDVKQVTVSVTGAAGTVKTTLPITVKAAKVIKGKIDTVVLSLTAPAAGAHPAYTAAAAGPYYQINTAAAIQPEMQNGVLWVASDGLDQQSMMQAKKLTASDSFQTGKYHIAIIAVAAEKDCVFTFDPGLDPECVTVNGKACYMATFNSEETELMVYAAFDPISDKKDGEKKGGGQKVNPFTDVFETDDYYDAVIWAYYAEPQVTNGITATQFGPGSTVTRGQAATFLWRAMGCPEPKSSVSKFEDVQDPNYYYYKAVLWAVEQGIAKGTDATHFTPEQTCSTAHIVTFLYRTMGIGADGWYEIAEAWAQGAGLLKGMSAAVAPGVDCPRAGVVQLLYRALGA